MKRTLSILFVLILFPISHAFAHSAGIALGNPTGVNGQYHINPTRVMDFTLGYEFAIDEVEAILNYYVKKEDFYHIQAYDMDFLYGGGLKLKNGLGVHASVSTSHPIKYQQLEVFASAGGTVYVLSRSGLDIDAYLGIRYLF